MADAAAKSDVKRAKPQLNVYTSLLLVAVLVAILGTTVVSLMNMDATGQGPFDVASGR
jgi:cell division protein FtsN